MRLTQIAHEYWQVVLKEGDVAIDATLGNGHDASFIGAKIGEKGHLIGFDIQPAALEHSKAQIELLSNKPSIEFHLDSHSNIEARATKYSGKVKLAVFNLGYLPGSSHDTITHAKSTIPALEGAVNILQEGGLLSILAYRGHSGGESEYTKVRNRLTLFESNKEMNCLVNQQTGSLEKPGPVLMIYEKPVRML